MASSSYRNHDLVLHDQMIKQARLDREMEQLEAQDGGMRFSTAPSMWIGSKAEKLAAEVCSLTHPIPPPTRLERLMARLHPWGVPLSDMAHQHVMLYDYYAPMIQTCVCAAGLLLAFKLVSKAVESIATIVRDKERQCMQMAVNESGGEREFPRNKRVQKRVPRVKTHREFPQARDLNQSWNAQNGPVLEVAIHKNLCVVKADQRTVNGLFIFGHVLCLPQHIF